MINLRILVRKSFLFLGVLVALGIMGCTTIKKPFMYRVVAPSGAKGHMLGTISSGVPTQDLPPHVLKTFEQSDPVYLANDMTTASQIKSLEQILPEVILWDFKLSRSYPQQVEILATDDPHLQKVKNIAQQYFSKPNSSDHPDDDSFVPPAHFPGNQTLKQKLSPDQWNSVKKILLPIFDESSIEKIHIETALYFVKRYNFETVMIPRGKAFRLRDEWSMDSLFHQATHKDQKNHDFLDSLDDYTPECRAEMATFQIKKSFEEPPLQRLDGFDAYEQIYRDGDSEKLFAAIQAYYPEPIYRCIVTKRNLAWLPKIEKILEDSKAKGTLPFFAVGAGQLLGPDGILHLLQRKGYKLYRVQD